MSWLPSPRGVRCGHVACVGYDGCAFQPEAIGPDLPRAVTAADGSLWWRDVEGQVFWRQRSDGPACGRQLATWGEISSRAAGERTWARLRPGGPFPDGPVQLHHEDGAHEAARAAAARNRAAVEVVGS